MSEVEMKTAYLDVVLRIPMVGLDPEEQLACGQDEPLQASDHCPKEMAEAIVDGMMVDQDQFWSGSNIFAEIEKKGEVIHASWNTDPDTPRSELEETAVHIFKQNHASDDLELDINSVHPEQGKPTTAGSEQGVWVRCWKFIPMAELTTEEDNELE